MAQGRSAEIPTANVRRMVGTPTYTETKNLSLNYRRDADFIICIYCKQACDPYGIWGKHASTITSVDECRVGVCPDCASKQLSKLYSDS